MAASLALAAVAGCEPGEEPADGTGTANECGESLAPQCPDGLVVAADTTQTLREPVVVPRGPESIAVGDLTGVGSPQVYVGTNTTITRLDGPDWNTVTDIWTESDDGSAMVPLVADLTEDGFADLVIGLPDSDGGDGQVLLFPGPVSGPVDWETPHFELQGAGGAGGTLATADYNGDGRLDLLVQASGTLWIRFGPISESVPLGADTDLMIGEVAEMGRAGAGATADFNGDAIGDLLVGVATTSTEPCDTTVLRLAIAMGPFGAGTFGPEEFVALTPPSDSRLFPANFTSGFATPADFNGDGRADVLSPGQSAGSPALFEMLVYTELMSGNIAPTMRFPITGFPVGVVDWTGDGAADLIQASSSAAGPTVLAGPFGPFEAHDTQTCTVQATEVWEPQPGGPWSFATWVGDLENDGVADVIFGSTGSDSEGLIYFVRAE